MQEIVGPDFFLIFITWSVSVLFISFITKGRAYKYLNVSYILLEIVTISHMEKHLLI